jgi:hypothetical protein
MQEQVGEWSAENFGTEQPPEYPLIGAGEEMGELTTSVLKRAQGIDDSEKYADRVGPDAEKDAVGDIVIYLLDTFYRSDDDQINIADGLARFDTSQDGYEYIDNDVDVIRMLYTEYGVLTSKRFYQIDDSDRLDMVEFQGGKVAAVLRRFCEMRGYDFKDCVVDAWEEVSGRNWDADMRDA